MPPLIDWFSCLLPPPPSGDIYPGLTAVPGVAHPSPLAPWVLETLVPRLRGRPSALDWGSGRGRDVAFFEENGVEAYGYDPCTQSQLPPPRVYGLILCKAVINAIPSPEERVRSLRQMLTYAHESTLVVLVTREKGDIEQEAEFAESAERFGDGWIFTYENEGRAFQRGFTTREVDQLAAGVGLRNVDKIPKMRAAPCVGGVYQLTPSALRQR